MEGTEGGVELHLLPRPREIKQNGGAALPRQAGFVVTQRTRIVVSSALGGREFEGAQMLEDEIEQWTGWKLKICDAREMPGGADIIYVGDATKDGRVAGARLRSRDCRCVRGFDEQGYEISADAHRILVGGASAEGAFDGVQTLRQLLRPANSERRGRRKGKSRSRFLGVPTKAVGSRSG